MTTEYVEKIEGELKARFTKELKLRLPGFVTLQYSTAGAPDRSIVGAARQTNWEFKHGTPAFRSPGNQELECMRIAAAGHCRYVIWQEVAEVKKTIIAHPRDVFNRDGGWDIPAIAWCVGHDMRWLVEHVKREHGL
jgi:hypothetical protein